MEDAKEGRASWKAHDSSPLFQVGMWEVGRVQWSSARVIATFGGIFFNVCVNVCIVHNTHFLLGYLHLEGRGLTLHFNGICPTLALSRLHINV